MDIQTTPHKEGSSAPEPRQATPAPFDKPQKPGQGGSSVGKRARKREVNDKKIAAMSLPDSE